MRSIRSGLCLEVLLMVHGIAPSGARIFSPTAGATPTDRLQHCAQPAAWAPDELVWCWHGPEGPHSLGGEFVDPNSLKRFPELRAWLLQRVTHGMVHRQEAVRASPATPPDPPTPIPSALRCAVRHRAWGGLWVPQRRPSLLCTLALPTGAGGAHPRG